MTCGRAYSSKLSCLVSTTQPSKRQPRGASGEEPFGKHVFDHTSNTCQARKFSAILRCGREKLSILIRKLTHLHSLVVRQGLYSCKDVFKTLSF